MDMDTNMDATDEDKFPNFLRSLLPLLQTIHTDLNTSTLPTLPSSSLLTHARASLPISLPSSPSPSWPSHILNQIIPGLSHSSLSPHYYGFVTGGCTPAALFGDVVASIYDQNVQVHLPEETIATEVEDRALGMVRELVGLREEDGWGGERGHSVFTTGATAGNVLGLAMGREAVLKKKLARTGQGWGGDTVSRHGLFSVMMAAEVKNVVVLTTMPHSSLGKAASIVGVGSDQVVSITGSNLRSRRGIEIDFEWLKKFLTSSGLASIVVVSAGEVNTGYFATNGEDMKKLRELCDAYDAWIHVDGAFGLFGRVLREDKDREEFEDIVQGCEGLELADSIAGDAHKLLNVPYDCGFFFSRHRTIAGKVFNNANAAYLDSGAGAGAIPSPLNHGLENSRRFRALPVYCSLLAHGREGYTNMLRRQIRLARMVASHLWDSGTYRLLPEGIAKDEVLKRTFIIVLFRATNDALNDVLVKNINATRKMYVSGTVWEGQKAARIAISNWQVDVDRDMTLIKDVLHGVAATLP